MVSPIFTDKTCSPYKSNVDYVRIAQSFPSKIERYLEYQLRRHVTALAPLPKNSQEHCCQTDDYSHLDQSIHCPCNLLGYIGF